MNAADNVDVVLVYGTLMTGEPLNGLLAESELVNADARTKDAFGMFSLGAFPAATRHPEMAPIVGETYRVTLTQLRDLDRVEGHPEYYVRQLVQLADTSVAWCYLQPLLDSRQFVAIRDCDWRAWRARGRLAVQQLEGK